MNVSELQKRILELSHDEATPDTDMRHKALVWLNQAYREIMDELQPYMQEDLMQAQTLQTDDQGQATVALDVQRMVRVVDMAHGTVLRQRTFSEILEEDPLLEKEGKPKSYWMQGRTLNTHPKSNIQLIVRYVPDLEELEESGTEESIKLPKMYHYALIWGGLVWASLYERAFSAQGDIVLFQEKWDEARRRVKLSLSAKPDQILRTEALNDF